MLTLTGTTEKFVLTASSVAPLDYSGTYVDFTVIPKIFATAGVQGKITTIGNTDIVSAPSTNILRQLKILTITNIDVAVSNTIYISKKDTLYYRLTPSITLLAGESLVYMTEVGWLYYSATGSIKAQQTAFGSSNWIMYNSGGFLAGDINFQFDPATNTLLLDGTDANLLLKKVTTSPASPIAGNVEVYTKSIANWDSLMILGSTGVENPIQRAVWNMQRIDYRPGAAAGVWSGTVGANLGTAAIGLPTATNIYTAMRRSTFSNVVTTTNQQIGTRTEAMFWRGNAAGLGGFFMCMRVGFNSIKTGCRGFFGFTSGTTAVVTVEPSSLLNMLGFGFDSTDIEFTFMHNDTTLTCTKEVISGQGTLATNNTGYDFYIYCKPNDTVVYYAMVRTDTGAILVDSSVDTNLPVSTTLLTCQAIMSNGTANIVAGDAVLGVGLIEIYTER
jgi:hypothetical protein